MENANVSPINSRKNVLDYYQGKLSHLDKHNGKSVSIRNFKYWSGLNEFYCNGKVMLGPNGLSILLLTLCMVDLPIVVIYVFSILVRYYNL